ncbi:MAG: YbaB/EbfC family nucleoid-associated protein [Pseudonocardiales bacterium]|jgi:DNA-binding protein YbaB|nr:YbaB/EbfC family nucleoid-associated protein [Pseudonocardiales bacterium]
MDGRQWLAEHQQRLADLRVRAERVRTEVAAVTGSATSPDGAVTVTVAPGGALRGLRLAPRAEELTRTQLAALVVATAAEATAAAGRRVEEVVAPLRGPR